MKIFGYGDVNWIQLCQMIPACPRMLLEGLMKTTINLWKNYLLAQSWTH